jgi:tRNA(fMet)-specific endonuclease VapC
LPRLEQRPGRWSDIPALTRYQQQEVLDFDSAAAAIFDELKFSRLRIGSMDLEIGAIALDRKALLVSRNLRDFRRIPNVHVEDWTQ